MYVCNNNSIVTIIIKVSMNMNGKGTIRGGG